MSLVVATCPKFLSLLGSFYEALPDSPSLNAELVAPATIPEPYRGLLVHRSDMTSTLQRYHGEDAELRVLQKSSAGNFFCRHIVLEGARSRRPVEYGAIRIRLDAMSEAARRQVLECRVPLGGILKTCGIAHQSCPGGFFRVLSNELMNEVLELDGPRWLYGRCNCLSNGSGETIAEVIEILPVLPGGQDSL
jgi:hypothetical protein